LWNKTFGGPREWFTLQSDIAAALREAFSHEHPTTIEQVNPDDLPAFLSGLFSAIQWEAAHVSPERLIEMTRQQEELGSIQPSQNGASLQGDSQTAPNDDDLIGVGRAVADGQRL
jgi:hypothetical protein